MDVLDANGLPIEGSKAFDAPVIDDAVTAIGARLEERRLPSTETDSLIAEQSKENPQ